MVMQAGGFKKGIVLAGGSGSRLYPLTVGVSKQLLPVYDKPMIYYPLSCLFFAGIREILVISTPHDLPQFQRLLGDGRQWGVRFSYAVQPQPGGLAQAFLIGREFVGEDSVALVLGDNIFYGQGLQSLLAQAVSQTQGATIFGYYVRDPERYGVVELGPNQEPLSLVEKPQHPRSRWAVPGLYFYDNQVLEIAAGLRPSPRGELEITDINRVYLERRALRVVTFSRGFAWLDAGTHESLLDAGNFIAAVEKRQGLKIGCLEEIAYRKQFISRVELERLADNNASGYGDYLRMILAEDSPGRWP
jgi:glucose-1-phosphate thymidylyltransferase